MLYYEYIDDTENTRSVQHNAGIALLKRGVMAEYGIDADESGIYRGEYGKPYFRSYPDIYFSISHCSGLAVCYISDRPCGADAENIRSSRDNVARRIFSVEELEAYNSKSGTDRDIFFTSLWTLKEAYAKTDGRGISAMKEISFDFCGSEIRSSLDGYRFSQRTVGGGEYIISVCEKAVHL